MVAIRCGQGYNHMTNKDLKNVTRSKRKSKERHGNLGLSAPTHPIVMTVYVECLLRSSSHLIRMIVM